MALDGLKFAIEEEDAPQTKIRVFGVGGGGSNAVARMQSEGLTGVDFCVINTDIQALNASPVPSQLAIGSKMTQGLGAGSDPDKRVFITYVRTKRAAINGDVRANLDVVMNDDIAYLRNFAMETFRAGLIEDVPEAIGADHGPGMDAHARADNRSCVEGDIWKQVGVFADFRRCPDVVTAF